MKRSFHVSILAIALIVLGFAANTIAQTPIFRISAETQWAPPDSAEYVTDLPPAANALGGVVTYSKTFFNTYPVLYISFDGAGSSHNNATLLLGCRVNGAPCQAGGGGTLAGSVFPTGWVGLLKQGSDSGDCETNHLPGPTPDGDCHTNNINYVWCAQVTPGPTTVELRLASANGDTTPFPGIPNPLYPFVGGPFLVSPNPANNQVHYERATIIIDGTKQPTQNLCVSDSTTTETTE